MPAEAPAATAPAAAPAPAPAAPSPSPAPAAPPERTAQDYMSDAMEDFADMDAGKPDRHRDEKTGKFKPAEQPKKPEAKPEEKGAKIEKPEAEKGKEAKPETPEAQVEAPKPVKAAELRNAYEGLKKRVKDELEPEVQRLRAKVKEFETKPAEESGPLLEKVKSLETRNAELERHMQYVDYTQSQEFTEKYLKPYQDAWTTAIGDFRQLRVRERAGENELGEPVFKMRPATEQDLLKLGNMDLSDMDTAASEMFGASAPRAISHIEKLKHLASEKNKAEEEAKNKSGEWKSRQQAEFKQQVDSRAKKWLETDKRLREKYPKAFSPEEGDADDQQGHAKGFALADLLFIGPEGLSPEQVEALPQPFRDSVKSSKKLTPDQQVELHAIARLRMANHERKVIALRKANARIKELETALAEYEKSEPAAGRAGTSKSPGEVSKDWLEQAGEELAAMDRRS